LIAQIILSSSNLHKSLLEYKHQGGRTMNGLALANCIRMCGMRGQELADMIQMMLFSM